MKPAKKYSGDFETDPEIMYTDVHEDEYKSELVIFEKWQAFSAEMLRLSLLGIAVFGFFYEKNGSGNGGMNIWLLISVLSFTASSICALIYRYSATEALMHFLRGLKDKDYKTTELKIRDRLLTRSLWAKVISAICLASGAVAAVISLL